MKKILAALIAFSFVAVFAFRGSQAPSLRVEKEAEITIRIVEDIGLFFAD